MYAFLTPSVYKILIYSEVVLNMVQNKITVNNKIHCPKCGLNLQKGAECTIANYAYLAEVLF